MKLTLKTNLRLGLGLSLLILIISSAASYISIKNQIKSASRVSTSNEIIQGLDNMLSTLKDAETGQRGYLLTENQLFLEPYIGAPEKINALFSKAVSDTRENAYQQRKLSELKDILDKRIDLLGDAIQEKQKGRSPSGERLLDGKLYMDKARQIIKDLQTEEKRGLSVYTAELDTFSAYTPILIVVAAALALLITIFFYTKVSHDFDERLRLEEKLRHANEETASRIEVIQQIARQISNGDYNIRLSDKAKDGLGSLAASLNNMAESLQYSFRILEDKEWMQTGVVQLNEAMAGEKDIPLLANHILSSLVHHTKSHVGALYLFQNDQQLHLAGSYALEVSSGKLILPMGDGLIGQSIESHEPVVLENIPDTALTISYATGQTKPHTVLAFPIYLDNMLVGAIELGTLLQYPARKLDFVKTVAPAIGLAFHVAQNRKRLQEFLEETQAQAEELQAQHSELEVLNAELETQTQKIQASEEELRVQQEELLQSNQELEERTSLLEERNQVIQERNLEIQEKARQLEQTTKYKSEFLANMSHELRTPLNSILLLSKLMADNETLDKEYTEYASVIQSSGQGLLTLIDEILDLSKIEAGKMKLEIDSVPVEEVKQTLVALFEPVARDKGLEFKIKIREDVWKTLMTDKIRLEQILKNLLSNAFKFTNKGKVTLAIQNDPQRKGLLFIVKDTGIGIANEKLELVFQAFQQADGSTRRKFGGTGLGLSISKELAKLLGGDIQVNSVEGVGSEFSLFLPLQYSETAELGVISTEKRPSPSTESSPTLAPAEEKRYTVDRIPNEIEDDRDRIKAGDKVILIIEDDTDFAKILLDFTRKRKYKGVVAVRGDVGIEMAHRYQPLAILLDIQLPVKNGWEVMEELKSNPDTRPIPVHIMSSLELKKESLLKGAVDFINKPVALEHMRMIFEKLEQVLSKHPKKVLIVEENEQHAKALQYFLSHHSIHTLIANNVGQSIDALQQKEVDCVILDMGIPDKGAYETLETIKRIEGLEKLPIIIFTGKNLSKGEESRIRHYADTIVVKTAHSYQRILDEAGLFLHLIEQKDQIQRPPTHPMGDLQQVLKGKTVLIADDDVRNIFSLTKALEQHQMQVVSVTDGKEALKILQKEPQIDVVLMDMMMPEMDGYETTRAIRKMKKYEQLPILAVTAKAMMGDREKCIDAGASDYISKPVDIDQLVSLLRVWLYEKPSYK